MMGACATKPVNGGSGRSSLYAARKAEAITIAKERTVQGTRGLDPQRGR